MEPSSSFSSEENNWVTTDSSISDDEVSLESNNLKNVHQL